MLLDSSRSLITVKTGELKHRSVFDMSILGFRRGVGKELKMDTRILYKLKHNVVTEGITHVPKRLCVYKTERTPSFWGCANDYIMQHRIAKYAGTR